MNLAQRRAGFSKLAVPVVLIVILAVAGGYLFLTRNTTSTQSTVSSLPSVPVHSEVDQFIQDINARNVDRVLTFYNPSSVVVWAGSTGGLVGHYVGPQSIRLIYAASIGKTTAIDVNVSNYAEKAFSPTHINATFVGNILGNSSVVGNLTATVNVSQEWNWGNSGWQISRENWAYSYFYASLLTNQQGPSETTFPQWGYMDKGGNPDLVSEKSIEWHIGPFLAAGVYALLFGVAFVLAMRLRSRDRRAPPEGRPRPSATANKTDPQSWRARSRDS